MRTTPALVRLLILTLALSFGAGIARADDGGLPDAGSTNPLDYPDESRSPIAFDYQSNLSDTFCKIDIDTGWVPAGSPIQVRFVFAIACGYAIELQGHAVGSWPPRPGPYLHFRGTPRGGKYEMDFTVDFSLKVRLDINTPNGPINTEFDIPYVPEMHMGLYAQKRFTPFLLQGNPERPIEVQDDIPYTMLFQFDLIDILEATGVITPQDVLRAWLRVNIQGYAGSRFEGRRIVVESDQTAPEFQVPPLEFLIENEQKWLPVRPSVLADTKRATYEGAVTHFAQVSFWPEIVIEFLGMEIMSLPLFEIPIPIEDQNDYWVFDPESFSLALPDIAAASKMIVGAAEVGQEVESKLAIQNVGAALLRGEAWVDPPFFIPYPPRFEVDSLGAVHLPVKFRPTVPGPAEGDLVIYSNDPNESPMVVKLQGQGCEPGGVCAIADDAQYLCETKRTCGCASTGGPGTGLASLLLALGAFWFVRRRRG